MSSPQKNGENSEDSHSPSTNGGYSDMFNQQKEIGSKMSENTNSSKETDRDIKNEKDQQFKILLEDTTVKIEMLKAQQEEMENFDLYFHEARRQVRGRAKELISKIHQHESRLLEEIDAAKQSEYAKLKFQRDELDHTIKRLKSAHHLGYTVLRSSGESDIGKKLEVTKQIQAVESDERFEIGGLMKFSMLSFAQVRCNTAFGTISVEDLRLSPNPQRSCKKLRNTSISLPHGSNGVAPSSNCERLKEKYRTKSLGTPLSVSQSTPSLNVNTSSVLRSLSPCPTRRSPIPLLRHLNMMDSLEQTEMSGTGRPALCLWKLTKDGKQPGEISGPNDVGFLPDGNIVVCDRDNKRLQIFDQLGKVAKVIAPGLIQPRRIAVVPDGHIAVTDSNDNTVKVYDQNAQCIIIWGKKWYKSIFKSPCGIAINSKQQPIVSDMEKHVVTIYDIEGKKVKTIQGEGNGKTDFHSPSYLAVDCKDRILVADNWNQSVKVFSSNGKFLFQFNKMEGESRLKYPNGVCADAKGNIYVADWGNHRVSMFTPEGVFERHILTRDDGLYHPAGLAIKGSIIAVTAYSDSHSFVGLFKIKDKKYC